MKTKYHFGESPIERTPNWWVVHYMYTDEVGQEYYGRQIFDSLAGAREWLEANKNEETK